MVLKFNYHKKAIVNQNCFALIGIQKQVELVFRNKQLVNSMLIITLILVKAVFFFFNFTVG